MASPCRSATPAHECPQQHCEGMRSVIHTPVFKYVMAAIAALFLAAGAAQIFGTVNDSYDVGAVSTTSVKYTGTTAETATVNLTTGSGTVTANSQLQDVPSLGEAVLLTSDGDDKWSIPNHADLKAKALFPYTHGLPWLLGLAGVILVWGFLYLNLNYRREYATSGAPLESEEPAAESAETSSSATHTS